MGYSQSEFFVDLCVNVTLVRPMCKCGLHVSEYVFFGKEKTNTITSSDKQPRRTEQNTHLRFT